MSQLHLSRIISQALRDHGARTAALCGQQAFTYRQIHERALRLANGLRALGVDQGDRVAILMLNCHRYLELYYAAALSGIVVVPLNVRWGAKEFAHALMDSAPKVFAIDGVILQHLEPYLEGLKMMGIQHLLYADRTAPQGMVCYEELLANAPADPIRQDLHEDDLYGLFYTSGTTGSPKGVMLTHKNLYTNAYHAQHALRLRQDSVYLHAAPMFHLADGCTNFNLSWSGGTHAFIPRFEEEAFCAAVQRWGVTSTVLIPTMINWLLHHPARAKHELSSLREILYGASPMPLEVLKSAMAAFKCDFIQGYGMTEAAPLVSILSADEHRSALEGERPERLGSAGRPIPGVEVRVVGEGGQDAAAGQVGEVWIRGPNVMKGYWQLPEETAQVLDENGWYHSRDMGQLGAQGYLTLVDRKGDMIISGGENIYSTEVEGALYQHEAVLEAAVIGVPHARWVEAVKAVVVLKPGSVLSESELIAHCKQLLSPYKVPKHVEFVAELPKGGTGKILKHVLRQWHAGDKG